MIYIFLSILLILTLLMCVQESKKRKIGLIPSIAICILITPIFGYFIISNRPLRNPKGCIHCNNQFNEAEYCGVCGKNELGKLKLN